MATRTTSGNTLLLSIAGQPIGTTTSVTFEPLRWEFYLRRKGVHFFRFPDGLKLRVKGAKGLESLKYGDKVDIDL